MARIVILGAGFGGIYAARGLQKHLRKDDELIIVNEDEHFVFTPLLHEVCIGDLRSAEVSIPIKELVRRCTLIVDSVKGIDFNKQVVKTGKKSISYDYLLIALGSTPNKSFLPPKVKQDELMVIKRLSDAKLICKNIDAALRNNKQKNITILFIGAGATGIEVACEMRNSFRRNNVAASIIILQNLSDVFPDKPERFRTKVKKTLVNKEIELILGAKLVSYAKKTAVVETPEGKKTFNTYVILLTAGVIPVHIQTTPKVTDEKGFFEVNQFLEVKYTKNVWAVGDIASYMNPIDNKPVPMLAQSAKDEGDFVAKNIVAKLHGKPQETYKFYAKGYLLSLGKRDGVGDVFGLPVHGFLAWWLKRTVYALQAPKIRNKIRLFWTLSIKSVFQKS